MDRGATVVLRSLGGVDDPGRFDQIAPQLRVVASYGRLAGSARVRLFDWLDWLRLDADEFTYTDGPRLGIAGIVRSPRRAVRAEHALRALRRKGSKRLLISRRASPFSNGSIEADLLRTSGWGIYDFDDALWLSRRGQFSLAGIWRKSVQAADVVIAGNEMLANEARRYSSNVVMIPSCVDTITYVPKQIYEIDRPTAGWIGSPATEKYLLSIVDPLLQLNLDFGLRIKLISAGSADLGPLNRMVDRVEWRLDSYAADLASVDFGIMPLDDTEWSRGKCAYKILQYGAVGHMVVASPVGANRLALERLGGVAASNDSEWYEGIRRVLSMDHRDRRAVGQRARNAVEAHYSYRAWHEVWVKTVLYSGSSS